MTPHDFAPSFRAAGKRRRRIVAALAAALVAGSFAGCVNPFKMKPEKPVVRYTALPPRNMPEYLRGTIYERVDLMDVQPQLVSGFGLVVNLDNTGDNQQVPTAVREYMIREMIKRGFGSKLTPGFETTSPEQVLRDPRTAIVRVDAVVPPGARRGESVDVRVTAIPTSATSSVARGELYRTDLQVGGANPGAPGVRLADMVMAQGPIFIDPAFLLAPDPSDPVVKNGLRQGWVLDGGNVSESRPLMLRLRSPERRLARGIEARIENRFASLRESQTDRTAAAQDEAIIRVSIPRRFNGDWEHFSGLMTHLFFDVSPEFVQAKARELAAAAELPDAPLMNISYAMEGLGQGALPHIVPLMTHARPDVAFAAARAAAFLGDPAAPSVLAQIAATKEHPFRINAVKTLGYLPPSPAGNALLRKLLDADEMLVRVEAYTVLVRQKDPSIYSRIVNERFVLDVVPSGGKPLVYATRSGLPRIALIGPRPSVDRPFNLTTFDNRLTLVGNNENSNVTIFYRPGDDREATKVISRPDLAEILARLGGDETARGKLEFCYADVVAVLAVMGQNQQIASFEGGNKLAATFVLQGTEALQESILDAPAGADQERPAGDGAQPTAAVPTGAIAEPAAPPEAPVIGKTELPAGTTTIEPPQANGGGRPN